MKVALITDLHFGVKRSADYFIESQLKFLKKEFIPKLKKEKIKNIYILGDVMDNRDSINVKILNLVYEFFSKDLKDFKVKIIIGNHDIHYKTSVEVNSLAFLKALPNVEVFEESIIDEEILEKTGKKLLLVPWIIDKQKFIEEMENTNLGIDYCFGHFEIDGFRLTSKLEHKDGIPPKFIFNNFGITFSGHFHNRSVKTFGESIIQYIGSPFQIDRGERNEEKGFVILDLETGKYDFHNNSKSLKYLELKFPEEFTKKDIEGNIVDVIITYDENYKEEMVQKYLRIVEKYNPVFPPTVKIENSFLIEGEVKDFEKQSIEELLKEYIDLLEIENKEEIFSEITLLLKKCSR